MQCIFWTLHQTGTLFPRWNLTQKCSTCFPRLVVEGSVFALLLRRPQILNDRILMLDKRSNGSDPPGLILQALRWLISKKNVNNLQDAKLFYNITENCKEDVDVEDEDDIENRKNR